MLVAGNQWQASLQLSDIFAKADCDSLWEVTKKNNEDNSCDVCTAAGPASSSQVTAPLAHKSNKMHCPNTNLNLYFKTEPFLSCNGIHNTVCPAFEHIYRWNETMKLHPLDPWNFYAEIPINFGTVDHDTCKTSFYQSLNRKHILKL